MTLRAYDCRTDALTCRAQYGSAKLDDTSLDVGMRISVAQNMAAKRFCFLGRMQHKTDLDATEINSLMFEVGCSGFVDASCDRCFWLAHKVTAKAKSGPIGYVQDGFLNG